MPITIVLPNKQMQNAHVLFLFAIQGDKSDCSCKLTSLALLN